MIVCDQLVIACDQLMVACDQLIIACRLLMAAGAVTGCRQLTACGYLRNRKGNNNGRE